MLLGQLIPLVSVQNFSLAAAVTSGAGALAAWGAHSGTIQQWKELTSGAKQIRSES